MLNVFHKLTRRGTCRKQVREVYLRDDLPCGLVDCAACLGCEAGPGCEPSLRAAPACGSVLVLDTNVVLHQLDFLEGSSGHLADVVVPATVLEEVRHRSAGAHGRLLALLRAPARRFFAFANTHHRDTAGERRAGESANDYNDRLVRRAAAWLGAHYGAAAPGLAATLVTNDAASAAAAAAEGLPCTTLRALVEGRLIPGGAPPHLLELLAAAPAGVGGGGGGGGGGAGRKRAREGAAGGAPPPPAAAGGDGGAPAPHPHSGYVEHPEAGALEERLRTRRLLRGTVRVSRDCWFEARVMVHNVAGKGSGAERAHGGRDAATGGADALPILIQGREALNRAMDGDTVAIEILPPRAWKKPVEVLAVQGAVAAEDDEVESRAGKGGGGGGGGGEEEEEGGGDPVAALEAAVRAAGSRSRSGPQPTGRVVGILRRAWRPLCGSLEPEEGPAGGGGGAAAESVLFVPWDARFPRVRLETRQRGALADKRLLVAVDSWPVGSRYPLGHYVRTIGAIGEKAAENEVIMLEHDIIARPFSAEVLACLPPADWAITPANSAGRVDLRHLTVCSIDPPGCKDIDDALHARVIAGDPFSGGAAVVEVGVHIADVTHFVAHGTAIDVEASERANTTYLVERRLDMLPGLLTETLCSLKGGVDRFAFSVTWEVAREAGDAPGEWAIRPAATRFFKSIIHSRAAMTYAKAQTFLDDPALTGAVADGVRILAAVARCQRRRRIEAGALALASPEVRFLLDSETHDPSDVAAYETKETNSTVEEFMLLANCAVAARVAEAFPRCALLRRHPAPPRAAFDSLLAAARAVGVELRFGSGKELAESLDAASVPGRPAFQKLLRILTTRCMMQAVYFPSGAVGGPEEFFHYGLAAPIYTHFTSPIRRYADVVVHRLLAAALGLAPLPAAYQDKPHMTALADNMNKRHLMSQLAGRASASLHTNIFFKARVVVETALVMRLRSNGAVLLVPRFALERSVLLGGGGWGAGKGGAAGKEAAAPPPPRTLLYDAEQQTLADAADPERLRLRIFDEVKVALFVEERARGRRELVMRIVAPPWHDMPAVGPGVTLEDRTVQAGGK